MEDQENRNTKQEPLDIYPLGKIRRILLSLADYFLFFIIGIFVFTIASYPLARLAVNADSLEQERNDNAAVQLRLLYDQKLLVSSTPNSLNFTTDIATSEKEFIKDNLQGNADYNPFSVFYVTHGGENLSQLAERYKIYDKTPFFSTSPASNGYLPLLEKYQSEFAPLLDPKNALTSEGQSDLTAFANDFFLPFYHALINDLTAGKILKENDPLLSYRDKVARNAEIKKSLDLALIVSCYCTYFLVGGLLFILMPCLNDKGKTLGEWLLKKVRVGSDNLALLPRRERALNSVFHFVLDLSFVPFLPLAYFASVTNLFDLPALDFVALASFALSLISLVVLLAHPYNKDLLDFASRSIVIEEPAYLEIEKVRAYGRKR
jgi:hypothetical protein